MLPVSCPLDPSWTVLECGWASPQDSPLSNNGFQSLPQLPRVLKSPRQQSVWFIFQSGIVFLILREMKTIPPDDVNKKRLKIHCEITKFIFSDHLCFCDLPGRSEFHCAHRGSQSPLSGSPLSRFLLGKEGTEKKGWGIKLIHLIHRH